jgi:uncharacterized surface protein with fasciclin (FAS1) repeats
MARGNVDCLHPCRVHDTAWFAVYQISMCGYAGLSTCDGRHICPACAAAHSALRCYEAALTGKSHAWFERSDQCICCAVQAWAAAGTALKLSPDELFANKTLLTNILNNHVAMGTATSSQLTDGQTLTTLAGETLTVASG